MGFFFIFPVGFISLFPLDSRMARNSKNISENAEEHFLTPFLKSFIIDLIEISCQLE